jgi:uncharacterized membrane protein
MSAQATGLLVGGVLPAVLFALTNTLTKVSADAGIGIGPYIFTVGIGVVIVGICFSFIVPDMTFSTKSLVSSFSLGALWGLGIGCIAIGLTMYGTPLGKLVPLFNLNTLLSVVLALWIFSEWQQVKVMPLLVGTILITAGAVLVSRA